MSLASWYNIDMSRICTFCAKAFEERRDGNHCCSPKCVLAVRRRAIKRSVKKTSCRTCFKIFQQAIHTQKFCSAKCRSHFPRNREKPRKTNDARASPMPMRRKNRFSKVWPGTRPWSTVAGIGIRQYRIGCIRTTRNCYDSSVGGALVNSQNP